MSNMIIINKEEKLFDAYSLTPSEANFITTIEAPGNAQITNPNTTNSITVFIQNESVCLHTK